jgi:hypothetical protein
MSSIGNHVLKRSLKWQLLLALIELILDDAYSTHVTSERREKSEEKKNYMKTYSSMKATKNLSIRV